MSSDYHYIKRVKVKTANLALGMYIGELDKKWSESSFLFQGFPLETEDDLLSIQKECEWVYVDFPTRESYHIYLKTVADPEYDHEIAAPGNELSYELPRANNCFKSSTKLVKNIMQDIIRDEEFDLAPVKKAVEDCIESILSNQDALLLLSNIKNSDEYTAEHCLRVSIMAIAFGKYLGVAKEALTDLGIGALLHDVGKMRVPQEILNKPGKLSPAEYNIMQDHAIEGYKILKKKKHLSEMAIDIAHSHHERLDGLGYPRKLTENQLNHFTKIVSIIDCYDAITSERIYSVAKSASEAFRIIIKNSNTQFDTELVDKFVEWLGVYPVGSMVELVTGEIGVVTKTYQHKKLKPRILLVTDEEKKSGYEKTIDLSHMSVHSSGEAYQIKATLPNGAYGIRLEKHINEGLILQG